MPSILPFRPTRTSLPTSPLPLPGGPAAPATETSAGVDVNLSGKAKCWFFIGRGRIGKTTLVRYVAETMEARGGAAVIAAADPVNRSLRLFLDGVAEPPSGDPGEVKDWLLQLLQHLVAEHTSGLIDLGGGDTSLSALLHDMPDLADVMAAGGVEPVAVHVVGTDPHDLTSMAMAEAAGFRPRATAIVLNEAHGRRARDFDQVQQHPVFQAAMQRGAVPLWMPLLTLDAARQIDANHWRYHEVKGKAGPFAQSSVHTWLRRMGEEMAPIATWWPEG